MAWGDLNERQQQYLQAVYETDQEQEADVRGMWKHGGTPRPASVWRWMEYGVFDGVGSTLYTKLYLRKLVDEGTGSTFNALAEAWKARPEGVQAAGGWYGDYGHIGWNTWLRLRDYNAGALIEEYSTWGQYNASSGYTAQIHWVKLSALGEQFYRDNWQHYHELYPEVDAPQPEEQTTESEA